MSLTKCHSMLITAGHSPYKVSMATVQAVMISGRYPCDALLRHWSKQISGKCMLSQTCKDNDITDDLEHILQVCPALQPIRYRLLNFTNSYLDDKILPPEIKLIVLSYCDLECPKLAQFLIDCSTLPHIISSVQSYGPEILSHFFAISRTWIYTIH